MKLIALLIACLPHFASAQDVGFVKNPKLSSFVDKHGFPKQAPALQGYAPYGLVVIGDIKAYPGINTTGEYFRYAVSNDPSEAFPPCAVSHLEGRFVRGEASSTWVTNARGHREVLRRLTKMIALSHTTKVDADVEFEKIFDAFGRQGMLLVTLKGKPYSAGYSVLHHGQPVYVGITIEDTGCTNVWVSYLQPQLEVERAEASAGSRGSLQRQLEVERPDPSEDSRGSGNIPGPVNPDGCKKPSTARVEAALIKLFKSPAFSRSNVWLTSGVLGVHKEADGYKAVFEMVDRNYARDPQVRAQAFLICDEGWKIKWMGSELRVWRDLYFPVD